MSAPTKPPCKGCGGTEGWYTSWSGGFAHPMPCEHCNPKGLGRDAFVRQVAA